MQLDPVTHTLRRDGVKAVLNPLDEFPLEAAIRLKRAVGGSVTAFTMGPPQADAVLRRAISMGADAGVLLSRSMSSCAENRRRTATRRRSGRPSRPIWTCRKSRM